MTTKRFERNPCRTQEGRARSPHTPQSCHSGLEVEKFTDSERPADGGRMVPSLRSICGTEEVEGEGYRSRLWLDGATQHILPPPWSEDA